MLLKQTDTLSLGGIYADYQLKKYQSHGTVEIVRVDASRNKFCGC
jgi:hypothetical protein